MTYVMDSVDGPVGSMPFRYVSHDAEAYTGAVPSQRRRRKPQ